jgi:hypothetical protein
MLVLSWALVALIAACGGRSGLGSIDDSNGAAASSGLGGGDPGFGGASGGIGRGGGTGRGGSGGRGGALGRGGSLGAGGSEGRGGSLGRGGSNGGGGTGAVMCIVEGGACPPGTRVCCPGLECGPEGYCELMPDCRRQGQSCDPGNMCCGSLRCTASVCQPDCVREGGDCSVRPCCGSLACSASSTCVGPRTCDAIAREIRSFVATHQQCSTDTDCGTVTNDAAPTPDEVCCAVPLARSADLARLRALQAEWSKLECGGKACCDNVPRARCIAGRCGFSDG